MEFVDIFVIERFPYKIIFVFKVERGVSYVKSATFVEIYCCSFSSEVVDEIRVTDDRDWHIVSSQLDRTTEDAIKDFITIALDPYLGQFVTRLQIDIAIKDSCAFRADHYMIVVVYKRELLNLGPCHIICTSYHTVDMCKLVSLETVSLILWHF